MSYDEPDHEWVIQYTPPILRSDLDMVQSLLSEEAPFIPGVFLNDPYDVTTYLPRQMIWHEEYCLLVDRNLVSRWIGMLSGQKATRQHRTAAAVLVFAQAADLFIEPNIAFYELSTSADQKQVNKEIRTFYMAEHVDPSYWADIALGRSDVIALGKKPVRKKHGSFDLTKPLYLWRRNYVVTLKIAELHLDGGRPEELMTRLLSWMYNDFLIVGPSVQLASYYFAPGAPRRKLLKHIQSSDRDRALAGIRNAAWDLTLISEWLQHVKVRMADDSERRVYILCTMDEAVKRMASTVISFDEEPRTNLDWLSRIFSGVWGGTIGTRLATVLDEYQSSSGNLERQLHRDPRGDCIDEMIRQGEALIRSWKPRGRSV